MLRLFRKRRVKRIKTVMVKLAKKNPDKLIHCVGYVVVWTTAQDKAIFLPSDFAGLSDQQIDLAIVKNLNSEVTSK